MLQNRLDTRGVALFAFTVGVFVVAGLGFAYKMAEFAVTIARDEVAHARLGWAHLAFAAERSDVGWLSDHVAAMLDAALSTELPPQGVQRLDGLGVLSRDRIESAVRDTTERVIVPGFARYGIAAGSVRSLV